jgi:hypothetical protein
MSRSISVFLFVDTGDLSFETTGDTWDIFKMEELPLMVRGRINMLRLAQDYNYVEGLGYKGKISIEDDLSRVAFSVKTLQLTVFVEDDELEQLRKLCPTIKVYNIKEDPYYEKAD